MSCLFEPIHGRFPTRSLCDSYPDCVGCSYSDPFKQPKQTNADRIRAMPDEELVKHLACQWKECKNMGIDCDKCLLEWLKQDGE